MANGKSIKHNYFLNLLYEIVLIVTPFITTPYVSRVLGADGLGVYSFTFSIVSYFVLVAGLGTTRYGQREVSYFQNNIEARSIAFWNTVILRILTTLVMAGVYFGFAYYQNSYRVLFFILSLNLFNVVFDISWFFQGIEEFGKLVGRNILFRILTVISIFTFVREANDVPIYTLCMSSLTAFGSLSLWPFLKGNIIHVKFNQLSIFSALKTTISFFIPTIAIQIYTYLDKTMIGVITQDSFQNGYYEQAQKIVAMALTVITSIGTVMIPRMGHYYSEGKLEEIKTYLEKSFRFVWMLSIPMCFGIIVIASSFVPWFFGKGFDGVIPLLKICSLLLIAMGINNVIGLQYLIPTGKQNQYTICVIAGAVINLICNLILIPKYGALGASVSSVIAEFCIAIIEFVLIRNFIGFISVLQLSKNYFISGLCMYFLLYLILIHFDSGIISTMLAVFIGMIAYSTMLLILHDSFFINNMKSILHKLHLFN